MRNYPFPLVAVLVLAMACASQAAKKPRPKPADQTQPQKVWTNDDLVALRAQGLISVVGQEEKPQIQPPAAPTEPMFPVYASRLDDPTWYADKAAQLQSALGDAVAALQKEQDALAQVKDRVTEPGLDLDHPSIGVTPDAALALLQARVDDIQSQLDELSDLARQHNIQPGALRG